MEVSNFLIGIAEVGAAFVGFSSIVAIFSHTTGAITQSSGESLYETFNVKFNPRSGSRTLVSGQKCLHPS